MPPSSPGSNTARNTKLLICAISLLKAQGLLDLASRLWVDLPRGNRGHLVGDPHHCVTALASPILDLECEATFPCFPAQISDEAVALLHDTVSDIIVRTASQ